MSGVGVYVSPKKHFDQNAKHRDSANARIAWLFVLWQVLFYLLRLGFDAQIKSLLWR
jgi:hypothetical protein